jgi:hypothetical protein
MACGDQKLCIIGEMENYVATMLRAQKSYALLQKPQRIAEPRYVEGCKAAATDSKLWGELTQRD